MMATYLGEVLGRTIEYQRRKLNMSRIELATLAGLGHTTVARIENGESNTLGLYESCCTALDITGSQLLCLAVELRPSQLEKLRRNNTGTTPSQRWVLQYLDEGGPWHFREKLLQMSNFEESTTSRALYLLREEGAVEMDAFQHSKANAYRLTEKGLNLAALTYK